MLNLCFSRGIREVTSVTRSENKIIEEGAAQEKVVQAEDLEILAEEIEGMMFIEGAETELELRKDPQESANGQNLERRLLNLIGKWDLKLMAAGTTANEVNGQERARNFSSM